MSFSASRLLLLAVTSASLSGCLLRNHYDHSEEFRFSWKVGDLTGAAVQAAELVENGPRRDKLLYLLEEGTTRRTGGDRAGSIRAFEGAEREYERWFGHHHKTSTRLSEEFVATIGSPEWKPYKTRVYERVMLWLYQALNYADAGDFGRARAKIFKTRQAVADAKLIWQKELQAARENMTRKGVNLDETMAAPAAEDRHRTLLTEARRLVPANLPDYVNPAALYMEAVYFLRTAAEPADFDKAAFSLRQLLTVHPNNPWILEDLAQAVKTSPDPTPVTYVFVETGRAAHRTEFRLEYPLSPSEFLPPGVVTMLMDPTSSIPYLGIALPRLRPADSHLEALRVEAEDLPADVETLPLADLDAIIAKEFAKNFPVEVAKAITGALAKAGVQYAVTDSLRDEDDTTRTVAGIGVGLWAHATTNADLRHWYTLPKKVLFCKVPTPSKKRLTLRAVGRNLVREVELPEGRTNVLWVRSVTPATPLRIVANFSLEPDL